MSSLEEIFSTENILAYSGVCLDLAVEIPETRSLPGKDFDTLVIPSRGAVPFFLGMAYGLNKLSENFGGVYQDFYQNLGVQETMTSLFHEDIQLAEKGVNGKGIRVLLIPFTADLNVERFDPSLDNTEFTTKTRDYWAKVTKSFFKNSQKRSKDPYFKSFADFVLRDIEGRDDLAQVYEEFPAINGFSMIDTVISGRAANDILGSFARLAKREDNPALNPMAFLVVDENGAKLKPNFSRYLTGRRIEGLVKMYHIPRIVSEDEGASLLGVGAAIYPSVMRMSRDLTFGGEEFFIGAGTWHNSSDFSGNYFENFHSFMSMIYAGMDLIYAKNYNGTNGNFEEETFNDSRKSFLDRAKKLKIMAPTQEDITIFNPSSRYHYEKCYETGSHVLHAPFTEKSEEIALSKILSLPGVQYSPK